MNQTTVTVPATTANLGPGFDCIGAALTLYNQFTFQVADDLDRSVEITAQGEEADRVSTDESNLLYQSLLQYYQHIGTTPPKLKIKIQLGVPLSRGLGSSATAIVGGLVGANRLAGDRLSTAEIMQLAIAIEGHPDNVVPALLGGCQLTVGDKDSWQVCDVAWHRDIIPVVAIPPFELSTQAAREVLPHSYSRRDAIFNVARMGMLVRGLATGKADWLREALGDRLHQPYRQSLISGYSKVRHAAIEAGAYGLVISGAGPTLLALAPASTSGVVAQAVHKVWQDAQVRALQLDYHGCLNQPV